MLLLLRLLAFCLLLNLSLTALASNGMSKDELDARKEFLQLKIESGKELLQKDIEAQGKRLDALDKRIDDQISRVSDIGNAVDRFAVVTGWIALVITGVLALGGLLGYVSVAKKAREEAETVSQKWFNDNQQKLSDRIQELEHAAARAQTTMDRSVAEVEAHKQSAIESMQKGISTGTGNTQEPSPEDAEGLRASVKQLKEKPEASYSYGDWNTRAFAAYQAKQFEDAALFWKYAAEVPNAGAINTAQALFNRAVTLGNLKRNEEAITTYEQIIATYRTDTAPGIREQVAKALFNKGVRHGKMGNNDKAIATYDQVIKTYQADTAPAIREQVAKALINKGVRHGKMGDNDKEIATYDQVIETYHDDTAPSIREQVAISMNGRGFIRLIMAKQALANRNETEANELLNKAMADLLAAIEIKSQWGMALGNLAYTQWLLKHPAEAEAALRSALNSIEGGGEELYRGTQHDIAQHPIPEDAAFREMLDRLWSEYQAQRTNEN